jgi:hypothetical protein
LAVAVTASAAAACSSGSPGSGALTNHFTDLAAPYGPLMASLGSRNGADM